MKFGALLLTLLMATAHAAPQGVDVERPDRFFGDLGLVQQLDQVRSAVGQRASALVFNAMGFLGVPYLRGGTDASTGFDCSGFVRSMYEQTLGLVLPRRAEEQASATQIINRDDLRPGDLVFFNTMRRAFSHVGIYVGDGKFIHSPRTGSHVRIEDMRAAYWRKRFNGARRVDSSDLPDGAVPTAWSQLPSVGGAR